MLVKPGIDPELPQANFIDAIFLSLIIPVSFTFGFSFVTDGWVNSQISYALQKGIEEIYC